MSRLERKYTAAATLMFISAALHLPIAALAFAEYGAQMIVAAILWTVLGLGLLRIWRWCAYLSFLGMLLGVSVALGGALDTAGIVSVLFWLIVVADVLAAVALFSLLWTARRAVTA